METKDCKYVFVSTFKVLSYDIKGEAYTHVYSYFKEPELGLKQFLENQETAKRDYEKMYQVEGVVLINCTRFLNDEYEGE